METRQEAGRAVRIQRAGRVNRLLARGIASHGQFIRDAGNPDRIAGQLRRNIDAHKNLCTHITPDHPVARNQLASNSLLYRLKVSIFKAILPLLRAQL